MIRCFLIRLGTRLGFILVTRLLGVRMTFYIRGLVTCECCNVSLQRASARGLYGLHGRGQNLLIFASFGRPYSKIGDVVRGIQVGLTLGRVGLTLSSLILLPCSLFRRLVILLV